jgi:hypothetical protein
VGSAEFELLRLACRPTPGPARIRDLLTEGFDGDLLIELAARHGVRPLLVRCLSQLSWQSVPAGTRQALEAFQYHQQLRALAIADELLKIVAAFAAARIPVATFKGPVLALQLYGDLALREYSDVDLVVPPRHASKAEQVLAEMGYRNGQGERAFRHAFLRHQRQYAFARDGLDAGIDLHWGFCPDPLPFPVGAEEIWPALRFLELGGRRIPTLADEELALLLAGHGTKEAWRSLIWVSDFARLVERAAGLDWRRVHRRARQRGCGDTVLLACAIAAALLDTQVPQALSGEVSGSARVQSLSARLIARMRSSSPREAEPGHLVDGLLCDRRSDLWKAWIKVVLTPSPGDYAALPLPPNMWGVYCLTRPFRLASRVFSGARSRS